jgi:hypothetical protein
MLSASILMGAYALMAQDVTAMGPKAGDMMPNFRLKDQQGVERDLRSLAGPKGTMLVFYRSADW